MFKLVCPIAPCGLTGSNVTQKFSYVKAIINFVLLEFALDGRNPFIGVYHDRTTGVSTRQPIPDADIPKVQTECRAIDDDMRWLIALIIHSHLFTYELSFCTYKSFSKSLWIIKFYKVKFDPAA